MAKFAGNVFPAEFAQKSQVNPQEKLKILVMTRLSTRRVGAEPGLMPMLAGGWLRPWLHCLGIALNIYQL